MANKSTIYRGLTLLSAANATGSYATWNYGSRAEAFVTGTFDGANVKLQARLENAGLSDIPVYTPAGSEFNITAARSAAIELPPGVDVKAVISSAGANTTVSVVLLAKGD